MNRNAGMDEIYWECSLPHNADAEQVSGSIFLDSSHNPILLPRKIRKGRGWGRTICSLSFSQSRAASFIQTRTSRSFSFSSSCSGPIPSTPTFLFRFIFFDARKLQYQIARRELFKWLSELDMLLRWIHCYWLVLSAITTFFSCNYEGCLNYFCLCLWLWKFQTISPEFHSIFYFLQSKFIASYVEVIFAKLLDPRTLFPLPGNSYPCIIYRYRFTYKYSNFIFLLVDELAFYRGVLHISYWEKNCILHYI